MRPDSGEFGQNSVTAKDVAGIRQRLPYFVFRRWRFFRASQTPKNIFEKMIFPEK